MLSQLSIESRIPSESMSRGGDGPAQSGSAVSTNVSPSFTIVFIRNYEDSLNEMISKYIVHYYFLMNDGI